MRMFLLTIALALLLGMWAQSASADTVTVGQISFDTTLTPAVGLPGINSFDLLNLTGGLLSPGLGVTDAVMLSGKLVLVESINGTPTSETKMFSMVPVSVSGSKDLFDISTDVLILSATLTGTFDNTFVTLNGGSGPVTLSKSFTVSGPFDGGALTACTGANDGACSKGILTGTTNVNPVPEPGTFLLLASGLAFCGRKIRRVRK
jgi:hypothetical protein